MTGITSQSAPDLAAFTLPHKIADGYQVRIGEWGEAQFTRLDYNEIKGWASDDHAAAFSCFLHSARRMASRPYSTKLLGIPADGLAAIAVRAVNRASGLLENPAAARSFFEDHFTPFSISVRGNAKGDEFGNRGKVTGYYEPEVRASSVRTPRFTIPLYRRPENLVNIDDQTRPTGMDPYFMFARRMPDGTLNEYPDRSAIEQGELAGKGLELVWLEDPIDAFFIHIQGSARLVMPDGSIRRVSYAGKTGHRFTAIGRLLIDRGELAAGSVTMQSIRAWLAAHPEEGRALMRENRSFIFFQEVDHPDQALGPVAAAGVPLSAGRSMAVDHLLHTFGTPIFVSLDKPLLTDGEAFRKLMIAQDTGSAITGPIRGDLFIGSGDAAGEIAGGVNHDAAFVVLVPNSGGGR